MAREQGESKVMGGYSSERFGSVVKAAAAAGAESKPAKTEPVETMQKQFTIKCVMGGYKLCWTKGGAWREQEAVATGADEVLKLVAAYLGEG